MVYDPAWFFSSLAQVSAAIIGFTFAFGGLLFNSRLDTIKENTDDLREKNVKLRKKYSDLTYSIANVIRDVGEFDDPRDVDIEDLVEKYGSEQASVIVQSKVRELQLDVEEIPGWAEDQDDNLLAKTWAYCMRCTTLLDEIHDFNSNLLSREEMDELFTIIYELQDIFDVNGDKSKQLYEEVVGEQTDEDSNHHVESIFPLNEGVGKWLEKYSKDIEEEHPFDISNTFNGRNISSFSILISELQSDYINTAKKVVGTKLAPLPDPVHSVKKLLIYTGAICYFGIIIPLAYLIVPSWLFDPTFTDAQLQLIQAGLIVLTFGFTALLYLQLFRFIQQRSREI